jgi:radical SAM protein with 4Fe4S-binding SPASM domain
MATQVLRETTAAEWAARKDLSARRAPLEGTLETTFRCNLKCVHCYVNEPVGDFKLRDRELPLARLKELIDEFADAGCLSLLMTGGEVLVRPDFAELYSYAVSRGLLVTIFTNGTLITERIADLFDEHRPRSIEISLYGMTRETYEKVTAVPGSYDKCIEGIERLVARGLPLTLKTMALTWNMHEIAAMTAYAESLGLQFRFDGLLNPRVDCGANRNGELQLSAEQAIALDLQDPKRMKDLQDFCARFVPDAGTNAEADTVYRCGAGQTSFTVDPYGQLLMCQLSRKASVDVREQTFAYGWNEVFPLLRERRWQTQSVCRTCNLASLCGSCPGSAEMETGSIEGLVAQFCEIAHLRADAVLGEKSGHRRDATCCLGHGELAARPPEEVQHLTENACGGSSCGSHAADLPASSGLIQIERRRSV